MAKRLKWGTIEYLQALIDEYFEKEEVPTIAGLRVHLDISDNCWRYYANDVWRTHRKSPEEAEKIREKQIEMDGNEVFEEPAATSAKSIASDYDDIEDDRIKAQVSLALKKAKDRIEVSINRQILTAKNPAGAIFYAKSALGYRETAPPEQTEQNRLPAAINIVVLPPPEKPQAINAVEAQFQVIDESPQSLDTTALQKKLR
jgi:hypothetical protein